MSDVFLNHSPPYISGLSGNLLLWDPPIPPSPLLVHTAVPGFLCGRWGLQIQVLMLVAFTVESPAATCQPPRVLF